MSRSSKRLTLSESIQSQANDPAYLYERRLILAAAKEQGGIPLFGRGPVQPIEPLSDPGFFGGVAHFAGAAKESNHLHPRQGECYVCMSGILSVICRRGSVTKEYTVTPHSILLVPSGVWHHVHWTKPGVAYVFRAPSFGGIEKLVFNPEKAFGF